MSSAVYPGSFDPVTNGHLDVIKRGLRVFDRLTVAVSDGPAKQPTFSKSERVDLLKEVAEDRGVSVLERLELTARSELAVVDEGVGRIPINHI